MTDAVSVLPGLAVALPALSIPLLYLARRRPAVRESVTLATAAATLAVVWLAVQSPSTPVTPLGSVAGVPVGLRADPAGLLFALLASTLWLVTSVYSVGYVRSLAEPAQTRYFAAFAASVAATLGVAFASNPFTLFVFYELLTIATYPLVVHAGTDAARRAGRTYVAYTLGGGVLVLAGVVLVGALGDATAFVPGGIAGLASADPTLARVAFALLAVGFGVKTALVPLHGWLPTAMVAPTPVSGLLHAVAVVKSGVFALGRTVLYVFGPETTWEIGAGPALAVVAATTILVAGVVGLRQDQLKRGLAYSTIGQLSYVALGFAIATPLAVFAAMLHVVAHAFMKITLFFAVGVVYAETGEKYVSDVAGVARRLPLTMAAFAVAAAGLVGFPLVAGFVSKFHLVVGAAGGPLPILAAVYLVGGLLKLLYFWPIVAAAFFGERGARDAASTHPFAPPHSGPAATDGGTTDGETPVGDGHGHGAGTGSPAWERRPLGRETSPFLLAAVLATVGGAVLLGVVPALSPFWALAEAAVAEVFA